MTADGSNLVGKRAPAKGDTSVARMLGILDVFTSEEAVWTIDMMVQRLGIAKPTLYRYVRSLVGSGLLVAGAGGGYVLGPRFIEFDRIIRLGDPLLQIVPPIIAELRLVVDGAQLLCTFYGQRVLTVLQDRTDEAITMSMERGRPFSLFLGAPSRIILANLPLNQLRNLSLNHGKEIAAAGLGETWTEFRNLLRTIRRAGYAVASDIDPQLVGISAPIFYAPNAVTASLCLVRRKSQAGPEEILQLATLAMDAARRISEELQAFQPVTASVAFPAARLR